MAEKIIITKENPATVVDKKVTDEKVTDEKVTDEKVSGPLPLWKLNRLSRKQYKASRDE